MQRDPKKTLKIKGGADQASDLRVYSDTAEPKKATKNSRHEGKLTKEVGTIAETYQRQVTSPNMPCDPAYTYPPRNVGNAPSYWAQMGPLCCGHAPGAIKSAYRDDQLPGSYYAPQDAIQNRAKKKLRVEQDQPGGTPVEHDQLYQIIMSRHEPNDCDALAETYQRIGLALPKRDSCVPKITMSKHGQHAGEALAETYQHQRHTNTSCLHQIIYHIFSKNAQHEI